MALFSRFLFTIPTLEELGAIPEGADKGQGFKRATPKTADIASSLRGQADTLQAKIDHLKNPAIGKQRPTPRRARIAEGMFQEGLKLERQQNYLRALADAWDAGNVPDCLKPIRRRAQLDTMTDAQRESLDAINTRKGPSPIDLKLRELERRLIGQAIPGYFPTPAAVVARMLELVGDDAGPFILEPSAGKGDIAQALRRKYPGAVLDVIEQYGQLAEVLELKGFNVVRGDFLEYQGHADAIAMNPPFEHQADIQHIRHAYGLLSPGGVLVSVVCENAFFRQDRTAEGFRVWLQAVGAYIEELPPGSFLKSDRPTGVNTRLIKIAKMRGAA